MILLFRQINLISSSIISFVFVIFCSNLINQILSIEINSNSSFPFWSSYRPNVYFGLRSRSYNSPLFGLLHTAPLNNPRYYFIENNNQQLPLWINRHEHLRHEAEERDKVDQYGYKRNNLDFGQQNIIDSKQNIQIKTNFISLNNSIITRISANTLPNSNNSFQTETSLFWYVSIPEKSNQTISLISKHNKFGIKSGERISVKVNTFGDLGELYFESIVKPNSKHPKWTTYLFNKRQRDSEQRFTKYFGIKSRLSWDVKPVVREALLKSLSQQYTLQQSNGGNEGLIGLLPNSIEKNSNLIIFQHILTTPFEIDFMISDRSANTVAELEYTRSSFNQKIEQYANEFDTKFDQIFQLSHKSIDANSQHFNRNERYVARAALSNLIGGIGYFYGDSLIELGTDMISIAPPNELFSTSPTRSFFPRGFLWDEGFHQLVLSEFDLNISLNIFDSWFNLIDDSGWLAREQILGAESRKRVPLQFQKQSKKIANPPTLLLALAKIITRLERSSDSSKKSQFIDLIQKHWPRLLNHADWYFATQSAHRHTSSRFVGAARNESSATTFAWKGCGVEHCLASGIDDAPRAPKVLTEIDCASIDLENGKRGCEGHVDLHVWMIALTNAMSRIADFTHSETRQQHFKDESKEFLQKSIQLHNTLDELHWNAKHNKYCDYRHLNGKLKYNCHDGYISLFPFMLGMIQLDSNQLIHAINQLSDPNGLWSDYGIRSLSKQHSQFRSGEDYWRGHVWININFLIVQSLKHYGEATRSARHLKDGQTTDYFILRHTSPIYHEMHPSPFDNEELYNRITKLYNKLRKNLICNVVKEYNRAGYFYEQYHEETGEGRRSQAFTGWTALILLIMAEIY